MGADIGRDITWDDVRAKRDQFLKNSDSEITDGKIYNFECSHLIWQFQR
mgnify:CR=1 FL=1